MFNAFLPSFQDDNDEEERADASPSSSAQAPAEAAGAGVFSFFEMAKEVAANVQKSSTEIVQSVAETDWGKEFRDFGSALQHDTREMVEETKATTSEGVASITIPKSKEEVQESMEVLGNTIESLGKSIIGGTTELLSQMKETVQQEMQAASIKHRQTQQEAAKMKKTAAGSEEERKRKRYEDKVSAMQRDSSTYCDEPEDLDYYDTWLSHFALEAHEAQIQETLKGNAFMSELQSRIVPLIVDRETFWTQYFFRLHVIQLEEGMADKISEPKIPDAGQASSPALVLDAPPAAVDDSAKAETPKSDDVHPLEDDTSSPSGFSPVHAGSPRESGSHRRTPSGMLSESDAATASDSSATDWINVKAKSKGSPHGLAPPPESEVAPSSGAIEEEGGEREGKTPQGKAEAAPAAMAAAPADAKNEEDEEELSPLPSPAPGSTYYEEAVEDDDIDEDWGEM